MSMTHLAAHHAAPPDSSHGFDLTDLLSHLGLREIAILGAIGFVLWGATDPQPESGDKEFEVIAKSTARGAWLFVAFVVRFLSGKELHGESRSDARFLKAGTRTTTPTDQEQAVALGSIALAPPKVSLIKRPVPRPRKWAQRGAAWIQSYAGRGARALDQAAHLVVILVRATSWTWKAVRTVYGVVAPIVAGIASVLGMWGRWPYAMRALARLALIATVVGLAVPAWRTWTIVALLVLVPVAIAAGIKWKPRTPGDDAVYGPRLWALLQTDLKIPDDAVREDWLLLPTTLANPDARIVMRLPWEFRGADHEKEQVTALLNSRLPGEWAGRFSFRGEHPTAVYTHKPPPKAAAPEPECPERVGFFDADIQAAIAGCKKGEVVIGKDAFGQIIIKEMGDSETPHWALSVGTGGGKSAFNQMVIAQLIRQGYHIIAVDVKRVSVENYKNVPGVYLYNDPKNPQDMRRAIEWFKDEIDARSAIKEEDRSAEFPGLLLIVEESNEFADISREWWDDNRKARADEFGPAERASDPIWGTVASAARLGRFVHGNILAVFQDLRDQALGGKGLRNLFRLKFMGNYSVNSWKNVIGTTPVPDSVDMAGRMMIVEGNSQKWVQVCFAEPEELTSWALEQRELTNFDPAAGLFGTPPQRSARRLPRLLEGLSRDDGRQGLIGASEGGSSEETAGQLSHEGANVTLPEGNVTASRDRLRLIPGQGGRDAQEAAQADPTAPPELLPLAEISRRLGPSQGVPKADTLRAHKARKEDFPKGTVINGKELFTESQILAYYQAQENKA
ncbi:hypothetical protein [Streptomyces sp. NPDC093589]|uniref:hypothetical protein n=1 Tax=Streptomyces sp. NPDC093589 TaxID=3366043 RepID=UPI0038305E26